MAQKIRDIGDIHRYKEVLELKLSEQQADMEENDDCVHNVVVNSVMLENCQDIRMYCGQMALFHNKFYDRVEKETGNDRCAKEAKNIFTDSLKGFIARPNSHLSIFVENPDKINFNDLMESDTIKDAMKRNVIEIFKVDGNLIFKSTMQHMTVGDKNRMVRWETDKESHSAQCFFHVDKSFEDNADTLFHYLKKAASPICYA